MRGLVVTQRSFDFDVTGLILPSSKYFFTYGSIKRIESLNYMYLRPKLKIDLFDVL